MFDPALDPCPKCMLVHARRVPCSVAIEAAKAIASPIPAVIAEVKRTFRKKNHLSAAARKNLSDKAKAFWKKKRESSPAN